MLNRGTVGSDNMVWDINTLVWVKMQQPILNAGSVTVSGTIKIDQTGVNNAVQTYADVLPGSPTSGPTHYVTVAGKTNDVTPNYLPIPLATPASGGTAIRVQDDGAYPDYSNDGSNHPIKAFGLLVPAPGGGLPVSPNFPLATRNSGYVYRMDYDGSNNLLYLGQSFTGTLTSDPAWMIRKFTYDVNNNVTTVLYAGGENELFNHIWDSRASYTYS